MVSVAPNAAMVIDVMILRIMIALNVLIARAQVLLYGPKLVRELTRDISLKQSITG